MVKTFSTRTVVFLTALVLFFLTSSAALAQTPERALRATPSPRRGTMESCLSREKAVETRMSSLVRFSTNMQEKFTAISLRIQDFYTEKVVPSGKTVENYDVLLATIAAKQSVVSTEIAEAQALITDFSCDDDNIQDHMTAFRTAMQSVKSALHEYRLAIKNLIVAVRSVAGELEPSPSPTPTPTPIE